MKFLLVAEAIEKSLEILYKPKHLPGLVHQTPVWQHQPVQHLLPVGLHLPDDTGKLQEYWDFMFTQDWGE